MGNGCIVTSTKCILVVEDDPELGDLLELSMEQQGYEVHRAMTGSQALKKAEEHLFDLILLDVMLPEIDGYHVAQAVSQKAVGKVPKILIMSSRDLTREKGIALMSGATSAIQKPFSIQQLTAEVSRLLGEESADPSKAPKGAKRKK